MCVLLLSAGFYNYETHGLLPSNVHSCRHVCVQQKSLQTKFNTWDILMTLAKEMAIVLYCQSVKAEIKTFIIVKSCRTCIGFPELLN